LTLVIKSLAAIARPFLYWLVGRKIEDLMTVENAVRVFAGTLILVSVVLTVTLSVKWLYLTGFVGLNLIQSAFTHFCPAEIVFCKLLNQSPKSA
jgi:hypothetical protein